MGNKVGIYLSMYGAHNRKGKSFTTDEDVLGEKPQNQYMLCGENEEKMILFLTSSNQVEKCCKGQPSSFGLSVFLFHPKTALLFYKSMRFCDWYIWYVYAAVAIPTVPWLKTEHPPQFPAYQTARRMFYYAVPVRCRNLQFKVFLLLMNSMSASRPLAHNLPGIW